MYRMYLSPTGGVKKVVDILTDIHQEYIDIDLMKEVKLPSFQEHDLCLFAVPSYGGRVPSFVFEQLKDIDGHQAKVILVVVYGNRDYDDTLLELKNFVENHGFLCLGAISAIAQHSIFPEFASCRPDAYDQQILKQMMNTILKTPIHHFEVPGHYPYKESKGGMKPYPNEKCISCMTCAKECPTHAINKDNPSLVDENLCMACMHCVSICPLHARHNDPKRIEQVRNRLKDVCQVRKECELFL